MEILFLFKNTKLLNTEKIQFMKMVFQQLRKHIKKVF